MKISTYFIDYMRFFLISLKMQIDLVCEGYFFKHYQFAFEARPLGWKFRHNLVEGKKKNTNRNYKFDYRWKICRTCDWNALLECSTTFGQTPQLLHRSAALLAKSLPNRFMNIRLIFPNSCNSPHFEAANIKLDIASFSSSGHSLS